MIKGLREKAMFHCCFKPVGFVNGIDTMPFRGIYLFCCCAIIFALWIVTPISSQYGDGD